MDLSFLCPGLSARRDEDADRIRNECSRDAPGHMESSSRKASTSLRERGRERGLDLEQVHPV